MIKGDIVETLVEHYDSLEKGDLCLVEEVKEDVIYLRSTLKDGYYNPKFFKVRKDAYATRDLSGYLVFLKKEEKK